MKIVLTAVLTCIWGNALAAEPTPNLPPADVVARVLRATPSFAAARGKVLAEMIKQKTPASAGVFVIMQMLQNLPTRPEP